MYDEIRNCNDWKIDKTKDKCKNANGKKPLAMPIPDNCRIMIISQAPSSNASDKQILADRNNATFNQFLDVFRIKENQFHKYFYWTHYGKCYPGKREGGDQWPKVHCADKFLKDEIRLCKQKGLSLIIGVGEPGTKYLFANFVEPNCKKYSLVYRHIINKTYGKGSISWMFIKHTAITALWSKSTCDTEFIKEILRPQVNRIINSK